MRGNDKFMRIAINCRSFLDRHYAGIGRYAYNLVKSLSKLDRKNHYYLYAKTGLLSRRRLPKFPSLNVHPKVDLFKQGIQKTIGDVDLYHSPSPDKLDIEGPKIVVTVHDLVYKRFPQGHTQDTIDQTAAHMKEIVAKASKIICCSQCTLEDLKKEFSLPPEKLAMVYQGVDKAEFFPLSEDGRFKAEDRIARRGVKGPFILSVGTIEPRKNIEGLILAYSRLRERNKFSGKLVLVGKKGWMSENISAVVEKSGYKKDVIFLGYVTNEELRYFYNMARAFVFPSFYEGFGFPILEAFSCGAAVVSSSASSCGEVAGDGALLIDPYKNEEITSALERILEDKQLCTDLKVKALSRAKEFSFEKTAQETLRVYEEVYG